MSWKLDIAVPARAFARSAQALGLSVYRAVDRWIERDDQVVAASIAFYAALSLFPLLMVLIATVTSFLSYTELGNDARSEILAVVSHTFSQGAADALASLLDATTLEARRGGPIGLVLTILTAGGLFVQIDYGLCRVWDAPEARQRSLLHRMRLLLFQRLRAFIMLFALGFIVMAATAASAVSTAFRTRAEALVPALVRLWAFGDFLLVFVIEMAFFTFLHRYVTQPGVVWRHAWRAGLLGAVLWEISREVFARLAFGGNYSAYGLVGAFLVLLLWIFVGSCILLLSAEYAYVLATSPAEEASGTKERSLDEADSRTGSTTRS